MTIVNIENFRGGLSLVDPSNLDDNQFEVLTNMFYNKDKRVQTRRGIKTFGNSIGSDPITSYFFFKNDTDGTRTALCTAGTQMYEYDEGTGDWNSIRTGLAEYEADGVTKTRWSFAVYLNVIYMCNGVDAYSKYDPSTSTYSEIGLSSQGTVTFTNATNLVNLVGHSLVAGDSVKFETTGTLPAELQAGKYYYVINPNANDFQLSLTPNGSVVTFTDDGTATTTCFTLTQPRVRYLRYMADSIYASGEDLNPSTVYTHAAGAATANLLTTNDIVVGGDELGRVNGLLDLGDVLLVFKDDKIYSVAGDLSSSTAIDSQNGGYCHRAIKNVENAILYYSTSGVDRLKPRNGVAGASALATEPLSDNLRQLLDDITPAQRNNSAGYYVDGINNYYFSFDTGNDNIPNKTLVYSSLIGSWSEYKLPALYDYGFYIDSDGVYHYLIASANGGQMFEIESGFQDFNAGIYTELKTKRWDFGDIGLWKTYDFVDIIGLKNEGSDINVEILVDGDIVSSGIIDDTFINTTNVSAVIGAYPIGINALGGSGTGEDIDLYRYLIRIPMYASGPNIQVRMYSESEVNVWTLDQLKISREAETIDLFPNINIS